MSLLPIVNAIVPTLPENIQSIVEVVLALLASYFHNETAKNSGATN